ncbi:hypothetical protein F5B22DRAFT_622185 [Xylaria bambusicola]|uniref:uncharacterized protein n=1 Tax=Xylaria bambusicola TaxID=326684 RepID=UPI0020074B45|nr:uncharacterized protein F5B22DRAFT_622185 [Xylaria bambusicola]KAI0506821.1 hypothetical protein F5B22DRAFT_622185 [Xylaria bambusicola]
MGPVFDSRLMHSFSPFFSTIISHNPLFPLFLFSVLLSGLSFLIGFAFIIFLFLFFSFSIYVIM